MSQLELVCLESDGWRDFREVRLASLADAGFTDLRVPPHWPTDEPRERRMRHGGRAG